MSALKFLLFLLLHSFASPLALANIIGQVSSSFQSDVDQSADISFRQQMQQHHFSLGASYGDRGQFIISQSVYYWTRMQKDELLEVDHKMQVMELGPQLTLFFNQGRNFYISGAYHFYAVGRRQLPEGDQRVRGHSVLAALGLQGRVFRNLYLGFSLNYHQFWAREYSVDNVPVDMEEAYQQFYPALNLSIRI